MRQRPACPPRWFGLSSFAHLDGCCRAIPHTRRVSSSLQSESLAHLPGTGPALNPLSSSRCTPYPNTHTTPQKNKKKSNNPRPSAPITAHTFYPQRGRQQLKFYVFLVSFPLKRQLQDSTQGLDPIDCEPILASTNSDMILEHDRFPRSPSMSGATPTVSCGDNSRRY